MAQRYNNEIRRHITASRETIGFPLHRNQHIAEKDLPELQKQIEEREKNRKEILVYKKRMAYLEILLKKPNQNGGREKSVVR